MTFSLTHLLLIVAAAVTVTAVVVAAVMRRRDDRRLSFMLDALEDGELNYASLRTIVNVGILLTVLSPRERS